MANNDHVLGAAGTVETRVQTCDCRQIYKAWGRGVVRPGFGKAGRGGARWGPQEHSGLWTRQILCRLSTRCTRGYRYWSTPKTCHWSILTMQLCSLQTNKWELPSYDQFKWCFPHRRRARRFWLWFAQGVWANGVIWEFKGASEHVLEPL